MKIADQIVLVTGGARGVGAAAVRAFAREGARVVINWRASGEAATALAAEIGDRAIALQADVTDRAAVDALVAAAQAHFGAPVTTVVNNALDYSFNGDARSQMTDIAWDDLAAQFSTVVRGALNTIQATAPGMAASKFGRVINIGTNLFQNPVVPYHDYTAAKAALLSLTRTAAGDLGPDGITVNMVSGGAKAQFTGKEVSISCPSVVVGQSHQVYGRKDVVAIAIPCDSDCGTFNVEVSIRQNTGAAAAQ